MAQTESVTQQRPDTTGIARAEINRLKAKGIAVHYIDANGQRITTPVKKRTEKPRVSRAAK